MALRDNQGPIKLDESGVWHNERTRGAGPGCCLRVRLTILPRLTRASFNCQNEPKWKNVASSMQGTTAPNMGRAPRTRRAIWQNKAKRSTMISTQGYEGGPEAERSDFGRTKPNGTLYCIVFSLFPIVLALADFLKPAQGLASKLARIFHCKSILFFRKNFLRGRGGPSPDVPGPHPGYETVAKRLDFSYPLSAETNIET